MSALTANPDYAALLVKIPPRVIRSEEQNEAYIRALHDLEEMHSTWRREEEELAELLTLLIDDFEEKRYKLPRSTPRDALIFLLDQHGLGPQDLKDISAGYGAALLSGLRDFDIEEIRRLSKYFYVSPELFF